MATFTVNVINSLGKVVQSTIEADNPEAARRSAARKGQVVSIKKLRSSMMQVGMSSSERYTFLVRMSSMLGAKLGSAESLRVIVQTFKGPVRRAASLLLEKVQVGVELPVAMGQDPKNFPSAIVALIKAGIQSGETWRALRDAADFEYQMQKVQKGANKDLLQAVFTFLMAGAITIASTEYFGPQVLGEDMFKNNPAVDVGWVLIAGNITTAIMVVLMGFMFTLLWLATAGKQIMPVLADRLILKVPYYKDLVLSRNNYATFYKLGLLINAGVRIEEALRITAEGAPRGALRSDLLKATDAVKDGRPWAMAMSTLHGTDRAALVSANNREDTSRTLDILSNQYRDLYIQRLGAFGPVVQTLAALFLSLSAVIMFGMTILPMLQLAQGMSM
ncbi:type II secretion system F family protein [Thalassospira xianhensis]|nr:MULTISPECIES: type II secretion system F family protein [Thalassospira]SOC27237.1 general secretion pathway protein F [Thalassospira xiamenensis]